jgi:thermitase
MKWFCIGLLLLVMAALATAPAASAVEPPNDELFDAEYWLHNEGQSYPTWTADPSEGSLARGRRGADINALEGWSAAGLDRYPSSGGPLIGMIDSGIDSDHPDLRGKVAECATASKSPKAREPVRDGCEDHAGHGTYTAGEVAAKANNGIGIAGVAFNSKLAVCRAFNGSPRDVEAQAVIHCLEWLESLGVRVVSVSLSVSDPSGELHKAVKDAWDGGSRDGMLIVAAAGNFRNEQLFYPAAYDETVAVGGTDSRDRPFEIKAGGVTFGSNYGPGLDIVAPARDIVTTEKGGGYASVSGTSNASPQIAGAAAILLGAKPSASARSLRRWLLASVDDLGTRGRDDQFGSGRLDLCKAAAGGDCSDTTSPSGFWFFR